MSASARDPSLDTLLDLDGQFLVTDEAGRYWVRFKVRRVEPTADRPHGLDYVLTLHSASNERLVGFDNAHVVQPTGGLSGKKRQSRDPKHRLRRVRPYEYKDAATLLEDFWREVDAVLEEKGGDK